MSRDFFIKRKGKAKYLYILLIHLYFRPKKLSIFKEYFKIELIYLNGTNKAQLIINMNI